MLSLILYLALIGVIVWAVTTYIPMAPPFKTGIYVLSAIFVVVLLFQAVGGHVGALDRPVPRLVD